MPSFKIRVLLVLEKKLFKDVYHILAWRQYWSCDQDTLNKTCVPTKHGYTICDFTDLARIGQAVLEVKRFEKNTVIYMYRR